jgi:hypothetical protein
MIEKGKIPPYQKCFGCEIQQAIYCLNDLRLNATGNIPSGCRMNALNSDYDTTCCPVYIQKKKKIVLRFETSGYPTALSCLRDVGCEETQVTLPLLCLSILLFSSSLGPPRLSSDLSGFVFRMRSCLCE